MRSENADPRILGTELDLRPLPTDRFKEKREAILAAAADQFNKQGIRGATLAEIAASVGLVTTSVTYYYRKKEDLAMACFMRSIAAQTELVNRAAKGSTAVERVRRFLVLNAEMMASHDCGELPPLIYFNDIRALPETHAAEAFAAYSDMFRSVRRLMTGSEPTSDQTSLSRAARNSRTHLLLSQAHWMRAWIGRHELDQYRRVAESVADLLLNGLTQSTAAWPSETQAQDDCSSDFAGQAKAKGETFLRAATELVNEKGYRGASVEEISAKMNVTKGSFYYDNDTKLDLVSACFERSFSVVRKALKSAEGSSGSGWQRACAAFTRLVRFQLSESGPLLRTSAEIALPDEEHRISVRRTYQRLTERIASMIVEGIIDGSIRPCNPAITAQLLSCAINAAAELQRWVPGVKSETVAELYIRPALLGLLSVDATR